MKGKWGRVGREPETEELNRVCNEATVRLDAPAFWNEQFSNCAMEHLSSLSADSSDDAIQRIVRLCSRFAELSMEAAEERWGALRR